MLLPLLSNAAWAVCDASCEEWKRRKAAIHAYDQIVFSGVTGTVTGGGVATRGGGPEGRAFAGLVLSPPGENPFLDRYHMGREGAWFALGPAASARPGALTVEGEAQANVFAFVFGMGLRAAGGAVLTRETHGWMGEGGARVFIRPGTWGFVLDASLGVEAAPDPALRGAVRFGIDWAVPFTPSPPHECEDPSPEWFDH